MINRKFYSALMIFALLTSVNAQYQNDPDCCEEEGPCCSDQCTDYDECDCKGTSGGTSTGSIRFAVPIPGYSSGTTYHEGHLKYDHREPSVSMFTIQGLKYHSPAAVHIATVTGDYSTSEDVTLSISDERGQTRSYVVRDGTVGIAADPTVAEKYKIVLLDDSMDPVANEVPDYVKFLNLDDDSYVLIDYATGKALKLVNEYGAESDLSSIDVVWADGVIRQIATSEGLVDLVSIDPDYEFEVRLYRAGDYSFNGTSGLYELNGGVDAQDDAYRLYNIKNPAYDDQDIDETYITRTWDGRTTQWRFQYFENNKEWVMELGELDGQSFSLLRKEQSTNVESQDGSTETYTRKVFDDQDRLLSEDKRVRERVTEESPFKLVEKVEDPTTANLVTSYSYYTSGDNIGRTKSRTSPAGKWVAYEYDSEGNETLQVESWLDVAYNDSVGLSALAATARSIESSYTPFDTNDDGSVMPDTPRRETTKIKGVVSRITWYAYYRDGSGLYHEIKEHAKTQTSSYGDADNLRSEKIFYASVADGETAVRAGRLKSERFENGVFITYDYANSSGNFIVTETRLHVDSTTPVSGKSLQIVKTYDALANLTKEETFVRSSSSWSSMFYVTYGYDDDRNHDETRRFDGISGGRVTYSAIYDHGMAIEEVDAGGIKVLKDYDILDRLEMETIEGSTAAGVGDIIKIYSYSTAATGCGCSASEVLITDSTGTLTMTEINETDRLDRKSKMVTPAGLETTYNYTNGGRTTTVTRPDTSTVITARYLDGRIKSVTGTGVVNEYYTYDVNTDGSAWSKVNYASSTSSRWAKTTRNLLGFHVKSESPAYDSSTYTVTMVHDEFGRIISWSQPGQADTRYEYNSVGDMVLTGLDLDDSGDLEADGSTSADDRIWERELLYQLESGSWFYVLTTKVYPDNDSSSAVTVSTVKQRMNGFSSGTDGGLARETIQQDVHGNETTQQTWIDRSNKTVVAINDTPGSATDAKQKQINGYLKERNSTTVSAASTYSYDGLGRLTGMKNPRHTNSSSLSYFTGTRQVQTETDADGNATAYTYYADGEIGAGQAKSITNALSQTQYFEYNLLGQQTRQWGDSIYPVEYGYTSYNELSTLITFRDSDGDVDFSNNAWPTWDDDDDVGTAPVEVAASHPQASLTTWIYQTSTGLLTRKQYADSEGTDYAYDSANRLNQRTWARGNISKYAYTDAGELDTIQYFESDGTTADADTANLDYDYDRLGRLSGVVDATGSRSFSFDGSTLQLASETLPSGFYGNLVLALKYQDGQETHGLDGRAAGFQLGTSGDADAHQDVTYAYQAYGRLHSVGDGTDTFIYGYVSNSNLIDTLTGPYHNVANTYETNRDVITKIANTETVGTSSLVSNYAYRYDDIALRSDRVDTGSAYPAAGELSKWSYNDSSELIAQNRHQGTNPDSPGSSIPAQDFDYDYDKIGNRVDSTDGTASTRVYTTNNLNQYTAITNPSDSPTHDDDGNLTFDGTWTLTWNGENRLIEATDGSATVEYTYDYRGRLVKRDDGSTSEVYVYDGWNRIGKFISGSQETAYLWGLDLSGTFQGAGGVGGLLKEGSFYPLYDANGNIMQEIDSAGDTDSEVGYDPFGNVFGTLSGDFGFSTKPIDVATGYIYYGFRSYHPDAGSWLSRDIIGESGGFNLYSIAENDIINHLDYLGLEGTGNCLSHTFKEKLPNWDKNPGGISPPEGSSHDEMRNWLAKFFQMQDCSPKPKDKDCECDEREVTLTMWNNGPDGGPGFHTMNKDCKNGAFPEEYHHKPGPNEEPETTKKTPEEKLEEAGIPSEDQEEVILCCPKNNE